MVVYHFIMSVPIDQEIIDKTFIYLFASLMQVQTGFLAKCFCKGSFCQFSQAGKGMTCFGGSWSCSEGQPCIRVSLKRNETPLNVGSEERKSASAAGDCSLFRMLDVLQAVGFLKWSQNSFEKLKNRSCCKLSFIMLIFATADKVPLWACLTRS